MLNVQVYCLMKEGQGWTLIARISNNDSTHWRQGSDRWNDKDGKKKNTTGPLDGKDMISPAFWLVGGNEFMITRSDDPYTALLQTTDDCLGKQTFRDKFHTGYGGNHRRNFVNNQCVSSCNVTYGGQYRETDGFEQANKNGCSPPYLQTGNKIGFLCKYVPSDSASEHFNWAVMMIGAGGDGCSGADHGIGIGIGRRGTGDDKTVKDFGNQAEGSPTTDYSLNLWVR